MRLWFWVAIAAVIVGTSMPRLGDGLWAWRAGSKAAGLYGGTPLEWEWVDVAQSAWFAEGDARWQGRRDPTMKGQNVLRFVPGLAVAWLGAWTRDARWAAIIATWVCWIAAAVATYGLACSLAPPPRGPRIGAIAAGLVALSPGFAAFFGNVDAHPFSYAAVPLALWALDRASVGAHAGDAARSDGRVGSPWLVGAVLFLANATLELGPPLLTLLWLYYVLLGGLRRAPALRRRAAWAIQASLSFVLLQGTWWIIATAGALGQVGSYNEGVPMLLSWQNGAGVAAELHEARGRLINTLADLEPVFTRPVVLLFLPGLLLLPRRVSVWCVLWAALILAVSLLTRNVPRVQYLAFPALYLTAAGAAERAGAALAWCSARLKAPLLERPLRLAAAGLLLTFAATSALADLAGDLRMVQHWWPPG